VIKIAGKYIVVKPFKFELKNIIGEENFNSLMRWKKPWQTIKAFLKYKNWKDVVDHKINPTKTKSLVKVGKVAIERRKTVTPEKRFFGKVIEGGNKVLHPFETAKASFRKNVIREPFYNFLNKVFGRGLSRVQISKGFAYWWHGQWPYRLGRVLTNEKVWVTQHGPKGAEKQARLQELLSQRERAMDALSKRIARKAMRGIDATADKAQLSKLIDEKARLENILRKPRITKEWVPRKWWSALIKKRSLFMASKIGRAVDRATNFLKLIPKFPNSIKVRVIELLKATRFGRFLSKAINSISKILRFVGNILHPFDTVQRFLWQKALKPVITKTFDILKTLAKKILSQGFIRTILQGLSRVVKGLGIRVVSFVTRTVLPLITKAMAPAISSALMSFASSISATAAGITSYIGSAVAALATSGVFALIALIFFIVMVVGAAIMMVTALENQINPPKSNDIRVVKTLSTYTNSFGGESLQAVIEITNISSEDINIDGIYDTFSYVPNSETCGENLESVTTQNGHGKYYYICENCVPQNMCETLGGCPNLSLFPNQRNEPANKLLRIGQTRSWNFELRDYKGSTKNNPTSKGTYFNNVKIEVRKGVQNLQAIGYASAKLDINGSNSCMAKYEAPCGCPLNLSNPSACLGANIMQDCRGSFSHQNLEAVDVSAGDGANLYAPVGGTLTRWVRSIRNCDPTAHPTGTCVGFGMGVYLVLENSAYKITIGHLKASSADVAMFNAVCDPNPYCASAVQVGNAVSVAKGDRIGLADNSGYSTDSHIHYEIHRMPQNSPMCPTSTDGRGSLLDGTANVCLGVSP
jgi:hypothetical protein